MKLETYSRAIDHFIGCLSCPDCSGSLDRARTNLRCRSCGRLFPFGEDAPLELIPSQPGAIKDQIAEFWGDIYQQWYASADAKETTASLLRGLKGLEDLFRQRRHLPGTELDLRQLKGKRILEIGSGAGAHSALFRTYGANVLAVDYTPQRVLATQMKFDLLSDSCDGIGMAVRADAERLPLLTEGFDLVYSSGVLHHTENTSKAIDEVFRVLKPEGRAVIMLYSRHSALYWLHLLPRSLVTGLFFTKSEAYWLGILTEGKPKLASARNPITRVYSRKQLLREFSQFKNVALRKFSFNLSALPIPKAVQLREAILKQMHYKGHAGGILVYGKTMIPEIPLELALGRYLGSAWAISATKG